MEEMQKDLTGSPSERFTTLPTAICTVKNETDLKSRKGFRYIPLPHEPQKIQSLPGKRRDLKFVLLLQTVLLEQGTPKWLQPLCCLLGSEPARLTEDAM